MAICGSTCATIVSTAIVVVAITFGVANTLVGEVPIQGAVPGAAKPWTAADLAVGGAPRWILGNMEYDVKVVDAPAASGTLLSTIAWVLTRSPFGYFVRRTLLQKNQFHEVRELAYQAREEGAGVMEFPVLRLDAEGHALHESLASAAMPVDELLSAPDKLPATQTLAQPDQRYWEINDYATAYRSGSLKPSAAIEQVVQAIEDLSYLGAFFPLNMEDVQEQVAASDARFAAGKPLSVFDGVPFAVKNMIDCKGYVTTHGTRIADNIPAVEVDDTTVRRFKELGAIMVGVTAMTEFGVTPMGFNSHMNATRNPYDTAYYSGGSSSGSAVAVAAGLVPFAIGFDGGGSIRIPSAVCGIVGLMTGYMRTPFDSGAQHWAVVHAGPMAATVRDAALAYSVMAQNEPGHFFNSVYGPATGLPVAHLSQFNDIESLAGIRIGIFREHFEDAPADHVAACDAAVAHLVSRGAIIVPVAIPNMHALALAHAIGISTLFSESEDWRFWHDQSHGLDLEPHTRIQVGLGMTMNGVELRASQRLKSWAFDYMMELFETIDVLANPTLATATKRLPDDVEQAGESDTPTIVRMLNKIFLGNLLGFPAVTMPVGYSPTADSDEPTLPIGLHLMSNQWQESLLLRLAHALESQYGSKLRKRPEHFFDAALNKE